MRLPIFSTLLFLLMMQNTSFSQGSLDAVYQLYGKMEMASAFKFNPDFTFEFYYSYGAVDRQAAGTYKLDGNNIILTSDKAAGLDFHIIKESRGKKPQIKVSAQQEWFASNVVCRFIKGNQEEYVQTEDSGVAQSSYSDCDVIMVLHGLYPDEWTLIKSKENQNQSFEIGLNPSLEKVSFKGVILTVENDVISVKSEYLFGEGEAKFQKLE
ncbi:MAG: hypothetical protein IPI60_18960 [Saprospiraceae bacterium]|nr:hypothetical protein [Saprospiraceae bacterium]